MIVLNTTFYVHESIDGEFRRWIREEYLPSAIAEGMSDPSVSKIMMDLQENTNSYAVQLSAEDMPTANEWHDNSAALMRDSLIRRHGEKVLFFTTYMERIEP